jgi:TRAP-type uncharacterized transport system substrate-binding protein
MLKKMSCVMVLLGLLFATTVQAKEVVSIATAMAGGAWYAAGGAIADIINNHVEGVTATAQTTVREEGPLRKNTPIYGLCLLL